MIGKAIDRPPIQTSTTLKKAPKAAGCGRRRNAWILTRRRIQTTSDEIKLSGLDRYGRLLEQEIDGTEFGDGPGDRFEPCPRHVPKEMCFA